MPSYGYQEIEIPQEVVVSDLPYGARRVYVNEVGYYEADGMWFQPIDDGYMIVERPVASVRVSVPVPRPHISFHASFSSEKITFINNTKSRLPTGKRDFCVDKGGLAYFPAFPFGRNNRLFRRKQMNLGKSRFIEGQKQLYWHKNWMILIGKGNEPNH